MQGWELVQTWEITAATSAIADRQSEARRSDRVAPAEFPEGRVERTEAARQSRLRTPYSLTSKPVRVFDATGFAGQSGDIAVEASAEAAIEMLTDGFLQNAATGVATELVSMQEQSDITPSMAHQCMRIARESGAGQSEAA